jgi:predicted SprT family Zn-dependent metalloprotease
MSADRDARKAFEAAKQSIAQSFLEELDKAITHGQLSELAETTGGIKLRWTNKLNTTAGRANWKRETVRTRNPDGSEASVQHRHHASIELAEKVIDDEHRLLNVIAHEFCHLANFMVSGITNNPHGKEFKAWAAKCSRRFGDRGIEVTTKHSYDIDFKYVWECTGCAMEYKRHSKSINPDRHRCGSCKSQLKQVKPVPRAGARKPSEYQQFMKEQMKLLKEENPKSPQKEIMKRVADRWSSLQASSKTLDTPLEAVPSVDEVAARIEVLELDGADGGKSQTA